MKRFLASLVAIAFLSVSGYTLAADKKDDEKKADKPKAGAAKDAKAPAKAKKKKKEGC